LRDDRIDGQEAGGMVRWGLIGASDIAETRMIPAINSLDDSQVVAVVSSDADRARAFANRNDIPVAHVSIDALLADPTVDAVYISTTNEYHKDQTLAAAGAGKHVLCEKPLALGVADALVMESSCASAGVVFGTNHHLRNASTHRTARRLVQEGQIGVPLAARVFHAVYLPQRLQGWRLSRPESGGGVVLDITVHDADTLRFDLDDDPVEVTAMTTSQGLATAGLADGIMGVIRFESGLLAQFHDAFTIGHTRTGLEVHGAEASIRVTEAMTQEPDGEVLLQRGERVEAVDIGLVEDLYARSVHAFNDAIRGEGVPSATGRDGVWSLAVALAAQESADTGCTIPIVVP
jgi:1,5-anhydro-D-fructose reductase (1,5-anhydro-D-mannitol-forming)